MHADVLIAGAIVIAMDAERRVLADGAVALAGDRIVAVGKADDIAARVDAAQVIDARGHVLTPGFVNCHVHITETLIRGFLPEALPFDEEIGRWVIPLFEGSSPEEQVIGAKLAVAAMLRTGTTTFLEAGTIIAFDDVMRALETTGIRARTGRWTLDKAFDPNLGQGALTDAAFAALEADCAAYPDDGRRLVAWPNLIGHATATDDLWVRAKALADATGTGISAHMSPVAADAEAYLEATGQRPVVHLEAIGALGPNVSLVHMVHVDEAEIAALSRTGTNVIHCPGAAIRTGMGSGPHGRFPEMTKAGIPVALGTDGADNHDMMKVMTLMAALFKDAREDRTIFPAHEVLEMATLNGAKAVGMAGEIGAIAPGMKADIVLHDTLRPEWQPINDPVRQLVWSADGRGVTDVWVDGERVVEAGHCTLIDEAALYAEAAPAARALLERSGLPLQVAWPMQ